MHTHAAMYNHAEPAVDNSQVSSFIKVPFNFTSMVKIIFNYIESFVRQIQFLCTESDRDGKPGCI